VKILIAEDDFIARRILKEVLVPYGDCDIVVDGEEAVHAFRLSMEEGTPYDLVCLDIMMPHMDGYEALKAIREMEKAGGIDPVDEVRVIMITALGDPGTVFRTLYKGAATSYLVKPIVKSKLIRELRNLGLIS